MDLYTLSVNRISELLAQKEISSEELTKACLEHIGKAGNHLQSFITVTEEHALSQARLVDEKRVRKEDLSPLAGIPMALQDNICTSGIKTTCASRILHNFIPPYNATVAERLATADAVLVGKCSMQEFDLGSAADCEFPQAKTPHASDAIATHCNSGSATAVSAGEIFFALGTDTCGSVRQPAAACGIIGFAPSPGLVSRYGCISPTSSLGQIGTFTREMIDVALVLNIISGYDSKDSTSISAAVPDYRKYLVNNVAGLRVGIPKEYVASPPVKAQLETAIQALEKSGAICEEISMPHTDYALYAHYIISSAEASSNLARYDGVRHGLRADAEDVAAMFRRTRSEGFGTEVKRRIMLGTYALSTSQYESIYTKTLKIRTLVKQDFEKAFQEVDCLLTPTSPPEAFLADQSHSDPLAKYQSYQYTVPANLAGCPAMSLPFGIINGKPAGLQLIARPLNDALLLRAGYTLEQNTDQARQIPGSIG